MEVYIEAQFSKNSMVLEKNIEGFEKNFKKILHMKEQLKDNPKNCCLSDSDHSKNFTVLKGMLPLKRSKDFQSLILYCAEFLLQP